MGPSCQLFLPEAQHQMILLGTPAVSFSPFYFGVPLLKQNLHKKGTLISPYYQGVTRLGILLRR